MTYSRIKIGDIFYFRNGKNGNSFVSNDNNGIIVICNNLKETCYAKITKIIKIKDNFSIVEAKRVPYDIHDNMTYGELKAILKNMNYKIGFEIPFYNSYYPKIEQKQLLVYKLETGVIIHVETFFEDDNKIGINSIEANIPDSVHRFKHASGSIHKCTVPLSGRLSCENLHSIEGMIKFIGKNYNRVWRKDSNLNLFNYTDIDNIPKDYKPRFSKDKITNLWDYTIDRLWLIPDEIKEILGEVEELKPVFDKKPKQDTHNNN